MTQKPANRKVQRIGQRRADERACDAYNDVGQQSMIGSRHPFGDPAKEDRADVGVDHLRARHGVERRGHHVGTFDFKKW